MEYALNYKDILLRHNKSIADTRSKCDISAQFGAKKFTVPVVCSNMRSVLNWDICKKFDDRNWFYIYHRLSGYPDIANFIRNSQSWNIVSISIGIKDEDVELLKGAAENKQRIDYVTIDVALSYTDSIKRIIDTVKKYYPNAFLIVGNGATGEWIEFLENLGVDCAKINIGVSTSCRTRQFTGFGSSTVSSLIECAAASKNIKILADGGLTEIDGEVWVGDIAKAIALGADFLMSGRLFKSCIDSPALTSGYFGNASEIAKGHRTHLEGVNVEVKTNGLTINQMMDLVEQSLKSSISYSGGLDLQSLKNVKWSIIK